jgi:hypothetical protein
MHIEVNEASSRFAALSDREEHGGRCRVDRRHAKVDNEMRQFSVECDLQNAFGRIQRKVEEQRSLLRRRCSHSPNSSI